MNLYQGVVENRYDPLKLGRCQVRVVGLHTHDKLALPTEDLPWAYPMQPITSAAMSGIGHSPVGPVEGTWVVVMFRDNDEQYPVILGTLGGIPQTDSAIDYEDGGSVNLKTDEAPEDVVSTTQVVTSGGQSVTVAKELTPQQQAQNVVQPGTNPTTITTDIPSDPPAEFTTKRAERKKTIQALLAACDKLGITSREVKCSILAMAGGESGYSNG